MKDYFKQSVEELRLVFEQKRKIVILVHTNPDGDALGAALGLRAYFLKAGHEATVVSPNCFAEFFEWMPGASEILRYESERDEAKKVIDDADLIFGVDFNDFARINGMQKYIEKQKKQKIIIDHHPYPNIKVDYLFSCTSVSSASELTYEFIIEVALTEINKEIATCLYTGIVTDTGNFSHNDSHPRTYEIVADLIRQDIEKEKIIRSVYQNFSLNRLRLQGFALYEKLRYFEEYSTAYISLTQEELERFNFKIGDTEGFVNMPLAIKNVNFSVLFIEKEKFVKLSLRSKGNFDVNAFARKYFDGGGHKNAAGGRCFKPMNETLAYFESLLSKDLVLQN